MLSRNRSLAFLIGVLLIELFVFSYQAHNNRDIPIARQAARLIVTPIEQGIRSAASGAAGLWSNYFDLRDVRRENKELRRELDEIKLANQALGDSDAESKRIKLLLDFREKSPMRFVAAKVIGSGGSENSRLIVLNKGTAQGVLPDMPVMVPEGIVGKVLRVFLNSSQVLLMTDESSGVAALFESSRIHGIVRGKNKPVAWMDYVSNDDKVAIGERIFTSGEDRIFPKGLPVAVVVVARPGASFQEIQAQPLARLDRLEEVLIVTNGVDRELPPPGDPGRTLAEMPASPVPRPADTETAAAQIVKPPAPPSALARPAPPAAPASQPSRPTSSPGIAANPAASSVQNSAAGAGTAIVKPAKPSALAEAAAPARAESEKSAATPPATKPKER